VGGDDARDREPVPIPARVAGQQWNTPSLAGRNWCDHVVGRFKDEGTLDLVAAVSLATMHGTAPYMGPGYRIPAFFVPALLVTRYAIFVLLGERWIGPCRSVSRTTIPLRRTGG
jgi:hypothetical protein